MPLTYHGMAKLQNGQAIFGGENHLGFQNEIHFLTCFNRNCTIIFLDRIMPSLRIGYFVIAIPDTISACIYEGNR